MKTTDTNLCYSVLNLSKEKLNQVPMPDVVITSKPDVWDPSRELSSWLAEARFNATEEYPAFTVWIKQNQQAP
jgi:hypothetical protein